jgi:folate-binding protein YgfZ
MSHDTASLRQGAALLRRPDQSLLRLRGRDHLPFLQRMLCNDINGLAVGQGRPAALLTSKSQVVCTLDCLRAADSVWALVPASERERCAEALDRFIIADDVELESPPRVCFGLYGPALSQLSMLAQLEGLAAYAHRELTIGGVSALAVGDDSLGVFGLLLFVAPADAATLESALVAEGASLVEPTLWEVARVEAGLPRMGVDLSAEHLLLEGGQLGRVSFEKGCYIGQEPVCRIHNRGQVNRRLVGLRRVGEASSSLCTPAVLSHPDKSEAGLLTSLVESTAAGGTIGLGYVHRKVADPGTRLSAGEGAQLEIVALPHLPLDSLPQTFPRYKDDPQ